MNKFINMECKITKHDSLISCYGLLTPIHTSYAARTCLSRFTYQGMSMFEVHYYMDPLNIKRMKYKDFQSIDTVRQYLINDIRAAVNSPLHFIDTNFGELRRFRTDPDTSFIITGTDGFEREFKKAKVRLPSFYTLHSSMLPAAAVGVDRRMMYLGTSTLYPWIANQLSLLHREGLRNYLITCDDYFILCTLDRRAEVLRNYILLLFITEDTVSHVRAYVEIDELDHILDRVKAGRLPRSVAQKYLESHARCEVSYTGQIRVFEKPNKFNMEYFLAMEEA